LRVDAVVGGCGEPVIGNDLFVALVDDAIVADPVYPIPYTMIEGNLFYGYEACVGEDQ
jgi:hypothetical protein